MIVENRLGLGRRQIGYNTVEKDGPPKYTFEHKDINLSFYLVPLIIALLIILICFILPVISEIQFRIHKPKVTESETVQIQYSNKINLNGYVNPSKIYRKLLVKQFKKSSIAQNGNDQSFAVVVVGNPPDYL